jgi:predicted extracellular nuclease
MGNKVFRVPGIVTAVNSNRFFMQDAHGDDEPATSDGIEVFTGGLPSVSVGDDISVTGIVREYLSSGPPFEQPTTRIDVTGFGSDVTINSSSNALPAPVLIGINGRQPPTEDMEAGIKFWESLEGMLLEIDEPITVDPTMIKDGNLRFTVVSDNGHYATGISERGTLSLSEDDFNPERIMVSEREGIFGFSFPVVDVATQFDNVSWHLMTVAPFC